MRYLGDKSLDSEILLDLEKGRLFFDYTLNKYQRDILSSNDSAFDFGNYIDGDIEPTLGSCIKDKYLNYKRLFLYLLYAYIPQIRSKIAYYKQDFEIYYHKRFYGTNEYTLEGQFDKKQLIYHIGNNLWFEYELEGDYKDKIKTIELKRRFVRNIHEFGTTDQQDGWNLIFTFGGIPMHGKCIIRYL